MKKNLIVASLLLATFGTGYLTGFHTKVTDTLVKLSTENEQMRFADERMTRSRTDFARPGVTQQEVDIITSLSNDYGIPAELLYAMRRTENGGRTLYMGANWMDPDIRKRYPPLWWQFAKAAKTWNQHLNRNVLSNVEVRQHSLRSFAKQWNTTPDAWVASTLEHLDEARGPKGLAVTEPPMSKSLKTSEVKAGANNPQAKGGGHKSSKNSHKEKKK